jgi:hypothetical protein
VGVSDARACRAVLVRFLKFTEGHEAKRRLEAYLNWLEETNELRNKEQERKHTENIILQRSSLLVALTIAALTFVQAGLFRLPPLIDLSGRKSIELKHK